MQFDPNQPMALLPDAAPQFISVLSGKILAHKKDSPDLPKPYFIDTNGKIDAAASLDAAKHDSAQGSQGLLAVVPIWGVLTPDGGDGYYSFGTSLDDLTRVLAALDANQNVSTIVLNIRSPGGTVTGTPEAAASVRAVRDGGRTKIVAVANGMMASAATWIGVAASEVVVTPSGEAGSIGVISMYADFSKMYESAGIKLDVMRIPAGKARFSGVEPLTQEMRDFATARITVSYEQFKRAMADNRGIRIDQVEKKFGGGEMMSSRDALESGLVDRIDTLDATIARLSVQPARRAPSSTRAALARAQL